MTEPLTDRELQSLRNLGNESEAEEDARRRGELLTQALDALEYHQEQTRPIAQTQMVIEDIRTDLDAARTAIGETP